MNHHIKEIGTLHESYNKDTQDFLRLINQINRGLKLKSNVMLVTMDVIGLFTSLAHEEGIKCMKEQLDKRTMKQVPTEFIIKLL